MEDRLPRKLAAILYADAAGYSRLTGEDEEGTHRLLSTCLDLIGAEIQRQAGRVVHYAGDAVLADFATATDALTCAVSVQVELSKRNRETPDERRIRFRIGINLGEVIVDRDDIYGDGVNIAARLESLAEPGGICVSESVRAAVGNKLPCSYDFKGKQNVKNIAEPIAVYRVVWEKGGHRDVSALGVLDRPAVAVLPFVNISGEADQDYFADGLTEDIITGLSTWQVFPVIARNSTFSFKGRSVQVKEVSRTLNARYVVEGSVRRDGKRVRVAAQLVDGENDCHIWAKRFDRELTDIFELQDDLTQSIIASIVPKLDRAELQRSSTKDPGMLDAWDYYLRGVAFLEEHSPAGNAQAREMFTMAIDLKPDYSDAHTGLALSYNRDILLQCTDNREATAAQALSAARRAVKLDDSSAAAHHVLSTALQWCNEHEAALEEARRAVELNPYDAIGLHALGNKSDLAGDPQGIARMELAQRLNPEDPRAPLHLTFLARAYVNAGSFEAAVECARRAIQRKADYTNAYFILALALAYLGHVDEGRRALGKCEELHPGFIETRREWAPYVDAASNRKLCEGLSMLMPI